MDDLPLPDSARRRNLRRLVGLRWVALAVMTITVAAVRAVYIESLEITPLGWILAVSATLNVWTTWRVRQPQHVSDGAVFFQLLADTCVLTGVLYFTGGWSNPFVSLFLLPLVIAATVLPQRHAWAMAAATFAAYTFLGIWNVPLPHLHHGHGEDAEFGAHVVGMWVSFVLSAGVIAYFVARMAATLRERDLELAAARERGLRDQHVLVLGTLAAGAAHQLGTPLATMAVMLRELEHDADDDPELTTELRRIREQVDACKGIISDMLAGAGQARGDGGRIESLDRFLEDTVGTWQTLRPGIDLALRLDGPVPAPRILAERTLAHTLVTLLDNAADAADASAEGIEMVGTWTPDRLTVEIRDRGTGIAPAVLARAGRQPVSTKSDGHGVGLLIANAALERFGGSVTLANRDGGGTATRVVLPLTGLAAT